MASRLIIELKSKDNSDPAKEDMLTLEQMELTEKNMGLNKNSDFVLSDNFWSDENPQILASFHGSG